MTNGTDTDLAPAPGTQRGFEPVVENPRGGIPSDRSASERQRRRQRALHETLLRAAYAIDDDGPPAQRGYTEGLVVVVATYNDGKPLQDPAARINTIYHLLLALEHQREALPPRARNNFKILVADNGMSPEQRARLEDHFQVVRSQATANDRMPPLCRVVDAPKVRGDDFTRTAGYARNMALREIRRLRDAGDPSFDAPVLIHDDDAVTRGIGDMYKLLSRHRHVVGAVAPVVHGVWDMTRHATAIRAERHQPRRGTPAQCRSFPSVFGLDGLLNFSVLFAFGGSRVPKTCSLLLHPRAIDDISSAAGEVFHVWRRGSFEDMCCSIGLSCSNWDLFECHSARAYDQVRSNLESRLRQQFSWAYDHATAFYDFSEVSKLLPTPVVYDGVSVLAPLPKDDRTRTEGWGLQRFPSLPGFPALQATMVRPEEIRESLAFVREQLLAPRRREEFLGKHDYALDGCFETAENLLRTVEQTLHVVDAVRGRLDPTSFVRVEVPFIDHKNVYAPSGDRGKHAEGLRFERDVRVARLLGNLGSMFRNPANDFARGRVHYLTLGPRQAT